MSRIFVAARAEICLYAFAEPYDMPGKTREENANVCEDS